MLSHRNTWNVSFVNLCSDMETTPFTPLSGMEYFTPASHQTFIRTSLAQTNLGRCRLSVVWLALIHDNMTTIMTWSALCFMTTWQQPGPMRDSCLCPESWSPGEVSRCEASTESQSFSGVIEFVLVQTGRTGGCVILFFQNKNKTTRC